MALVFELPLFVVGAHPPRASSPPTSSARTAASATSSSPASASRSPASTRSPRSSRRSRSLILFELSIWLSVLLDRRATRIKGRRRSARDDAVSADWVLPVDGPPLRDALVAWEDGRIVEVAPRPRRAPLRRRRDPARASSTPTRTSSTRSTPASATGSRSATGSERTSPASARSPTTRWSRSPAAAPPTRSPPGSRRRPTTASRAPRRRPRPSSGCARSSTSRSSARPRDDASGVRGCRATRRRRRARADRDLAARALHLLARGLPLVPLARHPGRHASRRERERERVARARHGPTGGERRRARRADRASAASATLADVLGPELLCAHCVDVDADEIALLARLDVPVAHCPRSNALLGCGIAPLAELRAAGVRVGLGTDSPASTPSFDPGRSSARRSTSAAPASGAPTPSTRPTRCASRRSTSARALGLDDEVGSLTPGKRADLTILSVAGSPYDPVEDPSVAAVFGGSPAGSARDDRRRTDPLPPRRDRVARGTQHRKRRPPANARVAPGAGEGEAEEPKQPSWEDQLFFSRLRNHAKWVFVLLAVVFAFSFVIFGVGSGLDRHRRRARRTSSAARSAAGRRSPSLQKKTVEHPKDAAGLARSGDEARSRTAATTRRSRRSTTLHGLKPKDADALRELAASTSAGPRPSRRCTSRRRRRSQVALAGHDVPARRPARSSARRSARCRARSGRRSRRRRAPARTTSDYHRSRPTSASASTPTRSSPRSTRRTPRSSSSWPRPRRTPATRQTAIAAYTKFLKLAPQRLARTVRAEAAEAAPGLGRRIRIDRRDDVRRLTECGFSDGRFHLHRRRRAADSARQAGSSHSDELRHQDRAALRPGVIVSARGRGRSLHGARAQAAAARGDRAGREPGDRRLHQHDVHRLDHARRARRRREAPAHERRASWPSSAATATSRRSSRSPGSTASSRSTRPATRRSPASTAS